jgi:transposase
VAERALAVEAQVFALWHRFKAGQIDRVSLLVFMQPLRDQFKRLLAAGLDLPFYKARGFCTQVLKLEPALWTFVEAPGVEPTNNAAERALRPAVLWRKGACGSTRSLLICNSQNLI